MTIFLLDRLSIPWNGMMYGLLQCFCDMNRRNTQCVLMVWGNTYKCRSSCLSLRHRSRLRQWHLNLMEDTYTNVISNTLLRAHSKKWAMKTLASWRHSKLATRSHVDAQVWNCIQKLTTECLLPRVSLAQVAVQYFLIGFVCTAL